MTRLMKRTEDGALFLVDGSHGARQVFAGVEFERVLRVRHYNAHSVKHPTHAAFSGHVVPILGDLGACFVDREGAFESIRGFLLYEAPSGGSIHGGASTGHTPTPAGLYVLEATAAERPRESAPSAWEFLPEAFASDFAMMPVGTRIEEWLLLLAAKYICKLASCPLLPGPHPVEPEGCVEWEPEPSEDRCPDGTRHDWHYWTGVTEPYKKCAKCGLRIDMGPVVPIEELAPDGWRPIETAPKDGTAVLVYLAPFEPMQGSYIATYDAWFVGARSIIGKQLGDAYTPTHWMPLPAPPEPDDE